MRIPALKAATLATIAIPLAAAAPAHATTPVVHTSYGAHYSPTKCTPSSATWRGHRRFYVTRPGEYGCMASPWYAGAHPVMVSFGPTRAPWYPGSNVHHGVDIDMPVGTPIRAAVAGTVILASPTMGRAYGTHPLLLRSGGKDHVLGHLSRIAVRNGQKVTAGQLLGWSGMSGVETEDGPHLHFEIRPAGAGYTRAVNPWWYTHVHRL